MIKANRARDLTFRNQQALVSEFIEKRKDILNKVDYSIRQALKKGFYETNIKIDKDLEDFSDFDFDILKMILENDGYKIDRDFGYVASIVFDVRWY